MAGRRPDVIHRRMVFSVTPAIAAASRLASAMSNLVALLPVDPQQFAYAGGAVNDFRPTVGTRSGGGGIVINAPFNINAPVYGVDDLDARFEEYTEALGAEIRRHRLALGVAT
jgi:hypothetical protein